MHNKCKCNTANFYYYQSTHICYNLAEVPLAHFEVPNARNVKMWTGDNPKLLSQGPSIKQTLTP